MTFYIENETDSDFGFDESELIRTVCLEAFSSEGAPTDSASVNVLITDSEGIRQFNRDYRNIDSPTDVLSFALNEGDEPPVLDADSPKTLGEIVISVERAKEQAQDFGHSFHREIAFLTVHGMLHLLGYDHMEETDRQEMEDEQRAVMEHLGILR